MAKIQNIGIGNCIRGLKALKGRDSLGTNLEVWQITENDGNSFKCVPVKGKTASGATLDTSRHYFVPIDTNVDPVTI